MKCRVCGAETEHEDEELCRKCLAEKLGKEIEKHPIKRGGKVAVKLPPNSSFKANWFTDATFWQQPHKTR
jgi:hypothetical protein